MASFEWIDVEGRFHLAVQPMPRPTPQHSLEAWRSRGVELVVSFQTEEEAHRVGLGDEAQRAEALGMRFERFPIRDHSIPDDADAALAFAQRTLGALEAGRRVVFHCFAGIGRSGLMAILTLLAAGFSYDEAQRRVSAARGLRVPETAEQAVWLLERADSLRPEAST